MSFLTNLFSKGQQDAGSFAAHAMGVLVLLAGTPAGAFLTDRFFEATTPSWKWALGGVALYLLGARAGQPKQG